MKAKELKDWHWPQNRWEKVEFACPHGIGHGDIHFCDGCCGHESYQKAKEKREEKK